MEECLRWTAPRLSAFVHVLLPMATAPSWGRAFAGGAGVRVPHDRDSRFASVLLRGRGQAQSRGSIGSRRSCSNRRDGVLWRLIRLHRRSSAEYPLTALFLFAQRWLGSRACGRGGPRAKEAHLLHRSPEVESVSNRLMVGRSVRNLLGRRPRRLLYTQSVKPDLPLPTTSGNRLQGSSSLTSPATGHSPTISIACDLCQSIRRVATRDGVRCFPSRTAKQRNACGSGGGKQKKKKKGGGGGWVRGELNPRHIGPPTRRKTYCRSI